MRGYWIKRLAIVLVLALLSATIAIAADPGTPPKEKSTSESLSILSVNSLSPAVTETGKISLSVDGLGSNSLSGSIIQVDKPAGATVRKAYMAAASTGWYNRILADGDVKIDSVGVNWDSTKTISNSVNSYNHWADVTSIVKPKIDASPAGLVDFTITEVNTGGIDGEILAVIFDDPSQTVDNTIVLLYGAQNVAGDTFAITLANPINKADPNLGLDLSLGISYGYQPSGQYSQIDVNSVRMTTSAGGQDDGAGENGALLTVGGIGDTNANPPNPLANDYTCGSAPRCDDELYNLLPFVNTGDTNINVYTLNPSNDDNIFFAALNLKSTIAIVGEGILLAPFTATNPVGSQHTVIATVKDDNGNPIVDRLVTFNVVTGPHVGLTGTGTTDANGQAMFTYTGILAGTDVIVASFVNSQGVTIASNEVTKDWIAAPKEGSISGMKFNDLNNNGVNDAEPGLSGWTITLTDSTGNTKTTTTDASGGYTFTGLAAGTYTVAEVQQPGWTQTAPQPVPPGTYTVTITELAEQVTGKDFGNFMEQPPVELTASCVATVNPSGNKIPTAGANPKSGQNPDGFYMIGASDLLASIFVVDTGSGAEFGPFASGTNIKYTEANGAKPNQKTIGGPNSEVAVHITGNGDASVYAVNAAGVKSATVSCLVPPPPK